MYPSVGNSRPPRAIDMRVAYSSPVSDTTGAAWRLHLTGLLPTRQAVIPHRCRAGSLSCTLAGWQAGPDRTEGSLYCIPTASTSRRTANSCLATLQVCSSV